MGVRVDRRSDRRDMAVEDRIRIGRHLDLHLLARPVGRRIGLDDIGDHPHRCEICDRVRRRCIARLGQKPRSRIARDDPSRDRARHQQSGIELAFSQDLPDFGVGLSEDPDRILCRFGVTFGRLLVGRGLIDILLRAAPRFQKLRHALKRARVQLEHTGARQQSGFRLQQIGAIDGKQDIALLDFIPEIEKSL